ncbi:MAG: Holliday junction resolvase RecU [Faecalibacillus sp.]
MVNYPNKKEFQHSTYTTITGKHYTAHRGMNLEEDLNLTNQYYLSHDIAIIHKKPTPIQIVKVDYPERASAKIVEAYFRTPSTTDYNGIYKGKYIDFEAKETKTKSFPFINISSHQIDHLESIQRHGGIAFIIIAFTSMNEVYFLDASYMIEAYKTGKRQSMKYETIKEKGYLIKQGFTPRLHYLHIIDQYYLRGDK